MCVHIAVLVAEGIFQAYALQFLHQIFCQFENLGTGGKFLHILIRSSFKAYILKKSIY